MSEEPTEYSIALETVPTPNHGDADCLRIEAVLRDFGIQPVPELVLALENEIDRLAVPRAREMVGITLKEMARRLAGNPSSVALRQIIRGNDGLSQEQAAAEAGCTRQNLQRKKEKIARRLAGGVQSRPLVE